MMVVTDARYNNGVSKVICGCIAQYEPQLAFHDGKLQGACAFCGAKFIFPIEERIPRWSSGESNLTK